MSHADVDEKENVIPASRERVNRGEQSGEQPREILSAWRWDIYEADAAILTDAHLLGVRSSATVNRDIVPGVNKTRRNFAEPGFESREMEVRHRHAVKSEHANAKLRF